MNKKTLMRAALSLCIATLLLGAGYLAGSQRAEVARPARTVNAHGDKIDPKTGRKVLYWHDPMVPTQHFDKPGKSPFMDMQLEPVFADEGGGAPGITIDPAVQHNLGVRYAKVRRQDVQQAFDAVGTTQFDESRTNLVETRVTGYIEHLYASAPMQRINKGAPIASLFVPDWIAPQEEYLALRRSGTDDGMLEAARARMRAISIPDRVVADLERTGKAQTHITLFSPETGVVSELKVRNGAMVIPGQTLVKVAGLSKIWLIIEVPEALALQVQTGMSADATFSGDATHHFQGRIREILPTINASSRTLQARLEIDNAAGKLTPGMLMRVRVSGQQSSSRLTVPSEAIITTGKRSIVIVKRDDDRLQPAEVTLGGDVGDETEVLSGLNDGDTVVASGQFLIDSEASLKSILPRLASNVSTSTAEPKSAAADTYETTGKVEQVTADDMTFSHQPVPALGWGNMTMAFSKPSTAAFPGIQVGDSVRFVFKRTEAGYELTDVTPARGDK